MTAKQKKSNSESQILLIFDESNVSNSNNSKAVTGINKSAKVIELKPINSRTEIYNRIINRKME